MFPNTSTSAAVPVEPVVQHPFEPERQETLRELMPYFSALAKSTSAGHLGTLEKYHDEMGRVIRWLGDIPPGRITPQYVHGAVLMKPSSQGARTGISSTPKKSRLSQPSPKKSRKTGL